MTPREAKEEILRNFDYLFPKDEVYDGGSNAEFLWAEKQQKKQVKFISSALDRMMEATADAMVGEEKEELTGFDCCEKTRFRVLDHNDRIQEEHAKRDELLNNK